MRRSAIALVCAALLAPSAVAQVAPVTKGSKADLKGATTVYVDTSYDRELRALVAARLAEEVPELRVVETPDEASVVLRFTRSTNATRRGPDRLSEEEKLRRQTSPAHQPVPRNLSGGARQIQPMQPRSMNSSAGTRMPQMQLDSMIPDEPQRYAFGEVLTPAGGSMREVMKFRQPVVRGYDRAARDFVRKFAKAYHEANDPGRK